MNTNGVMEIQLCITGIDYHFKMDTNGKKCCTFLIMFHKNSKTILLTPNLIVNFLSERNTCCTYNTHIL